MLIMVSPNGSDAVICIPYNKIYNIKFEGKSVFIVYDSGGFIEVNSQFISQAEIVKVTYDSDDKLKKVIEQFYNAIKKSEKVFYFGNRKPKKNDVIQPEIVEGKEGDDNWLVTSLLN